MQFKRPIRRQAAESVVPMINVVFLLLIFFMMSARIAPAPPFDLILPSSESDDLLNETATLYISAQGAVVFGQSEGAEAWQLLEAIEKDKALVIRADGTLAAPLLAQILSRLSQMKITKITLAVRSP